MLRIGQPGAPPEAPPPTPPPMDGPPPVPDAPDGDSGGLAGKYDAEKVPQPLAVYRGPDMGPFACGNCRHFDGQGGCGIVQGAIDPAGLCNLFESAANGQAPQEPDQDDAGAPPPLG